MPCRTGRRDFGAIAQGATKASIARISLMNIRRHTGVNESCPQLSCSQLHVEYVAYCEGIISTSLPSLYQTLPQCPGSRSSRHPWLCDLRLCPLHGHSVYLRRDVYMWGLEKFLVYKSVIYSRYGEQMMFIDQQLHPCSLIDQRLHQCPLTKTQHCVWRTRYLKCLASSARASS